MKVILLKENFKKGLAVVEKIIGKNLNLPILNNILINLEKSFLNLNTTDLEIAIKYWFLVKTEKEGNITVPAKFLYNFISSLSDEKLTLETKDQTLYIYHGKNTSQIKGQAVEEFPIIPKIKSKDFIEIKSPLFSKGLSQVVDFCALTQVRPEISGVYFNFQKDRVQLAATDSFKLAEKTLLFEKPLTQSQEYSFILPQKAAREIINIFSEKEGKMKIYFSSNQVMFEYPMQETPHPQIQLISRLIEGEYPNYQEIIPKKYESRIILKKEEFLNQIKTASLFNKKTNEIQINVVPKEKKIEISSQSPELGENQSGLPAKIEGKETKVAFNSRFLVDGLLNIKSEEVILELNGEEGPAVLRPIGDQSYTFVVMPIKNN